MSTVRCPTPHRDHHHHHADGPAAATADAFLQMARSPAGPARDRVQDGLIRSWLPMARRLAHKYRNRGEDTEDLEQVAALGLTKAVQRYDPTRGHAFESYAVPVITGEIKKHFRDHTWDVHVPRRVQELRNRVRQAVRELEPTTPSGHPSVERLAAHLDLTEEEVRLGLGAMRSYSTHSLDARPSGADAPRTLLETLGEPDQGYERVILRAAIAPWLRRLSERDRHVLYLRFYREMTQGAIADGLGISQMQVSRVLRGTCARIRQQVDGPESETRGTGSGSGTGTGTRESRRTEAGGVEAGHPTGAQVAAGAGMLGTHTTPVPAPSTYAADLLRQAHAASPRGVSARGEPARAFIVRADVRLRTHRPRGRARRSGGAAGRVHTGIGGVRHGWPSAPGWRARARPPPRRPRAKRWPAADRAGVASGSAGLRSAAPRPSPVPRRGRPHAGRRGGKDAPARPASDGPHFSTARANSSLFILERPSIPFCFASL